MNRRTLLLLGCILATAAFAQTTTKRELWVWKDANGVTHYSDVPGPGAKKIEVVGATTVTVTPAAPVSSPPPAARAQSVEYTALEIASPESGASFFGADAVVDVRLRSEPALAGDDRLFLYMDGKLVEGAADATQYTLGNLERGTHTLTALILDSQGKEKIRSAPVAFNVRQPTTIQNSRNVGPSLKPPPPPPPKPTPKPTPK